MRWETAVRPLNCTIEVWRYVVGVKGVVSLYIYAEVLQTHSAFMMRIYMKTITP